MSHFNVGKVNLSELNTAKFKMIRAKIDYFNTIKENWISYYKLREKTLFDFEHNKPIY